MDVYLLITLIIVVPVVLVISAINYVERKRLERKWGELRECQLEFKYARERYDEIESVYVLFKDGGNVEVHDAKSWKIVEDVYIILDEYEKAVAIFDRKVVKFVLIERKDSKE